MRRPAVVPVLLAASAALFLAAAALAASHAVVGVRVTSLGRVLADASGRTLYLFEADKGTKSACYRQCAALWPPLLTTGAPAAGAGVKGSLLGTTKRKDGKLQVTYAGHPLYFFAQDAKPGQVKGQGVVHFGGGWYVVSPAGKKIEQAAGSSGGAYNPPTSTTPSDTSGGYGP